MGIEFDSDETYAFILEDEFGRSEFLFKKELVEFLKDSNFNSKIVAISAWHSEEMAKCFLKAGATHVICFKNSELISDKSCVLFYKVFYKALFVDQLTVWNAFRIAKEEVKNSIYFAESWKYLMLMKDWNNSLSKNKHKWQKIYTANQGVFRKTNGDPKFSNVPSKIDQFIERNQIIFKVIENLKESNLAILYGEEGIGKSSIAIQLSNFSLERNHYQDGILFINAKELQSIDLILSEIETQINKIWLSKEDLLEYKDKYFTNNEEEK